MNKPITLPDNADIVVTMNTKRRESRGGSVASGMSATLTEQRGSRGERKERGELQKQTAFDFRMAAFAFLCDLLVLCVRSAFPSVCGGARYP